MGMTYLAKKVSRCALFEQKFQRSGARAVGGGVDGLGEHLSGGLSLQQHANSRSVPEGDGVKEQRL